jgi:hypothetical protein
VVEAAIKFNYGSPGCVTRVANRPISEQLRPDDAPQPVRAKEGGTTGGFTIMESRYNSVLVLFESGARSAQVKTPRSDLPGQLFEQLRPMHHANGANLIRKLIGPNCYKDFALWIHEAALRSVETPRTNGEPQHIEDP